MLKAIFEQILTVFGLVIGMLMIIFRKRFAREWIVSQIKKAKPEEKEEIVQLRKTEYGLEKIEEIGLLVVGLIFVISSLSDLILPQGEKYIGSAAVLLTLSIFAACGAIFVMLLILPFLWRKVGRYMKENYLEFYRKAHSPSMTDRLELMKSGEQVSDPVLRKLRMNAIIYTVIMFVILFSVLLFTLYTIVKLTS